METVVRLLQTLNEEYSTRQLLQDKISTHLANLVKCVPFLFTVFNGMCSSESVTQITRRDLSIRSEGSAMLLLETPFHEGL